MTSKTLFCVSTANSDLFKDNFRNTFTNHLPQFPDKSFNYKMSLGSIHLEKSFRTIGRNEIIFLLFNLHYNELESKYQDESDYIPNTIHKHFLHKFIKDQKEMVELVIILRPGRYRNTFELVDTLNYDLTQLGVNEYILFKQPDDKNKVTLTVTKSITRCIISSKLMDILGFNTHKSKRPISHLREISYKTLIKLANYSFRMLVKNKKIVGFELMPGKSYETKNKIRQNTYLPTLIKIYCLQLDETIESSNFTRLLAVCPGIDKNDRQIYEYQPLTEHFSSIAVSEMNKLNFELRDEKDSLLELDVGAVSFFHFFAIFSY